jgi:hypothetical protein
VNRSLVADDFSDESDGGALPVQALGTKRIDGAVLLDDLQVLVGELTERYVGRPAGIEQLIKERAAMIVSKPRPIPVVQLHQAAPNQLGQYLAGNVWVAERFAGD